MPLTPLAPLTLDLPRRYVPGMGVDLQQKRPTAKQMVRQVDGDGDGLITRAEFAAMIADLADPDSLGNYDMRLHVAVDEELQGVQLDIPTTNGA